MDIELVSKKVEWVSGEGVRTQIRVTAPHNRYYSEYWHHLYIQGIDCPQISVEVGRSLTCERDEWVAALYEWLATTDYVGEWEEEATKYRYVVSQVHLPITPTVREGCRLTYELIIGGEGLHISVEVVAKYEGAVVYIRVVEPDDYYEEYGTSNIAMGEVSLTYPITVHSVKAAIEPVVDGFLSKVAQLMGEPLVGMPPPEYFYDRS